LGKSRCRPIRVQAHCLSQTLRSSSQPLQTGKCMRTSLETEVALELADAEVAIVPLPLQHTKRGQAAREMMPLRPFRTGLTACQVQLIFADPDDLLNVRADAIQAAHLHRRQRQAIGGVVLLAVSDNQHLQAPIQPVARSPVRVPPMMTHRVPIEPAILFETAHEIPAIVVNPLQESFGELPGIKEHGLRAAAQAMAGIAEEIQRELVLRWATFAPQTHPQGMRSVPFVHTKRPRERPYTGFRSRLEKTQARPSITAANGFGITVSSMMR